LPLIGHILMKPARAKVAKKASIVIMVLLGQEWDQEASKRAWWQVAMNPTRGPAIGCHGSRKPLGHGASKRPCTQEASIMPDGDVRKANNGTGS